jgi:hypothetical protein
MAKARPSTRTLELRIELTKHADGGSVLRCTRADGSVTWQRHHGPQAAFFPLHDLTHYAIESELGFRQGFFGLIADGWDIADTGGKGARGALPEEAIAVEHLVGSMDVQRGSGTRWSAAELNDQVARQAALGGRAMPRAWTDDELVRARERIAILIEQWTALPPDRTLVLAFDRRVESAV